MTRADAGATGPDSSELTTAIGRPAHRALTAQGLSSYAQLAAHSERDLLAIHGVGPRAVGILREELAARGLSFSG